MFAPPLPPILDPISRQRRRDQEAEQRAHRRANDRNRLRVAQSGRILSHFEQRETPLTHSSACLEHGHDRSTCRGCRSTGHNRRTCPFQPQQPQLTVNMVNQGISQLNHPSQAWIESQESALKPGT